MAEEQEDFDALPLEDRLLHKVWKVRLNAYEACTKQLTSSPADTAPCFKPFNNDPDLLVKAVKDANVVAQEAGVALLLAYLQFGPVASTLKTRPQVLPALVEKCLGSTRAGTRQKAIDAVLMYVELDTGEPVIEDLIPGLSAKLPKLVAATCLTIKSIYLAFGAKTVKAKPAVQVLPKLFAHADKNVRAEAIDLAITLYRWLGDVVKPLILADLKPVQVKELETAFDGITVGQVKQERLLRSQQAAQEAAGPDAGGEGESGAVAPEEEEAVDAFDLAEPVDVLSTVPANFEEAMLSSKWKDRKEVLDVLVASSNVPRIKEGDFGEVARLLGRCVQKDANVVCVSLAATCLNQLARGLKRAFGRYRNVVFAPCAERFKEKKQNVLDAIAGALDAIFLTTTLDDVLEETLELLKSKNPSVRCQMLLWLARSLSVTPVFPKSGEVKQLAEAVTALIGESDAKVRDAAAECLGTLMKLIGERAMGPYLEQIEELRKPKILETFATATVKAKPDKPKPQAAGAAPGKQPTKRLVKKAPIAGSTATASSPTKVRKVVQSSGYGPRASMAPGSLGAAGGPRLARQSLAPGNTLPSSPAPSRLSRPAGSLGLQRPTAQNLARPSAVQQDTGAASLAPAERLELESLRREKAAWEAAAADREELASLRAQLVTLQSKNTALIESHTTHAMALQAKEDQYNSAQREVELLRKARSRYDGEIEVLKSQLRNARIIAGHVASEPNPVASPVAVSMTAGGVPERTSSTPARGVARTESVLSEARISPPFSTLPSQSQTVQRRAESRLAEEKENRYAATSSGKPLTDTNIATAPAAVDGATRETPAWQAASDLTAKLRSKIEQMKRNDAQNAARGV